MKTTTEEIRDLILTKIQNLTDNDSPGNAVFGEVFGYGQGDFKSYPVAVVRPTGGFGEEIDTHRNERTFTFDVSLYQEQTDAGKNKSEANQKMIEAADLVTTMFDEDKDLGGEVQNVKVVKFNYDFKVSAGTYIFATYQVEVRVVVKNY